jgi:hypothetical protein
LQPLLLCRASGEGKSMLSYKHTYCEKAFDFGVEGGALVLWTMGRVFVLAMWDCAFRSCGIAFVHRQGNRWIAIQRQLVELVIFLILFISLFSC